MRILLVEDEDPKRRHLSSFLLTLAPEAQIVTARSVLSALVSLEEEQPDVIILDMSLPTFDMDQNESGGRPQGVGGIEIMRHMVMSEIRRPVIVVTGYEAFPKSGGQQVNLDALRVELKRDFPELFCGLLHYNSAFDDWKRLLQDSIETSLKGQA